MNHRALLIVSLFLGLLIVYLFLVYPSSFSHRLLSNDKHPFIKENTHSSNQVHSFRDFILTILASPTMLNHWAGTLDVSILVSILQHKDEQRLQHAVPCWKDRLQPFHISKKITRSADSPSCVHLPEPAAVTVKVFLSIAVGRMALDADLNAAYGELQNTRGGVASMQEVAVRAVLAILEFYHTSLQTLRDISDTVDPQQFMSWVQRKVPDLSRSVFEYEVVDIPKRLASFIQQHTSTLEVRSDVPMWFFQLPAEGRYWNTMRATISCATVTRMCEHPEGCRFLCNRGYLSRRSAEEPLRGSLVHNALNKLSSVTENSSMAKKIEIVGIGSNNQFEWEAALLLEFGEQRIRAMTVADCTLKNHKATPPASMVGTLSQRFRFVPMCVAETPHPSLHGSDSTGTTWEQVVAAAGGSFSPSQLVAVLNAADRQHPVDHSANEKKKTKRHIDIMKWDVEGFEHTSVPSWLLADLMSARRGFDRRTLLVDFQADVGFFDVGQFQLEVHRLGHHVQGLTTVSLLELVVLQLHHYALGLLPFAAEKNHMDNCCYEAAWAHYRFLFASEMWTHSMF